MSRWASWLPVVIALAFAALCGNAHAASVAKISWDSKPQYNRFIMQFNQSPKYNSVNAVKEKGFFYIDFYGMTTSYKRRLLTINDNVVKYVDSISYPDHSVLRLVFYVKYDNTQIKVSPTDNPPRIVIDSFCDSSITITPQHISGGSGTSLRTDTGAQSAVTPSTDSTGFVPAIPEPRMAPPGIGQSRKQKYVIIDAGHGGGNSGAQSAALVGGRTVAEKELTLQFAIQLKKVIDSSPNMVAFLTRSGDQTMSLQDRVRYASEQRGDIFISIHMNDGNGNYSARGVEFYYLNEKGVDNAVKAVEDRENRDSGESASGDGQNSLLKSILTDLKKGKLEDWQYEGYVVCKKLLDSFQYLTFFRQNCRGVKSANFVVLKNFDMPSILMEVGFITNNEDLRYLITPKFQHATAVLVYNALNNYFSESDPEFTPGRTRVSSTGQ